MSYNPNNPNGQATMANSAPVTLASNQSSIPVTVPGFTNNTSLTGSQSATVSTIGMASVLLNISGTWAGAFSFQQSVDGINFFPLSGVDIINLNNQAPVSTSVNGTFAFNVAGSTAFKLLNNSTITGTAVVQLGSSSDTSVTNAILATTFVSQSGTWSVASTMPDLYVTGASAQTATVNNILTATSGTAATDLAGYHSATVQVVSTGTAGTFIFEGSNDNTNFQTIPVFNQLILTGTPITAAITATASQLIYTFPVQMRYVRLRIATAITGGSVEAFSKFSQTSWSTAIMQVAQATTANLQTTATIASGTITTVSTITSANTAIPGIVADVASAALTTTTTTATLTPTFGASYQVNIPVTAVTGTTPTLDIEIQESPDSGTNWYAVYDFPRITATGSYNSPTMPLTGNRIRYVQTVTGTTPSFTRAINRLQSSAQMTTYRQIVDRTISLTTGNSNTVNLFSQNCRNAQLVINIGASTTSPTLQLQGSDDNGSTWYTVGGTLTALASSTVSLTVNNIQSQFLRATVTAAGTGTTAGYVIVRGF